MSQGGAALQPTFQGHVVSTHDALILFEACLQGHLSHVPRRPHDRERPSLIRSGSVFVYEENASGIKRWTDGVTWSPSRILGNFLVYRELEKPFPPGEKKRAMKKQQRRPSRPSEPYARPDDGSSFSDAGGQPSASSELERQLIGSLVDSYGFKENGLVKKTMSVTVQGVTHHLVSYYHVHDILTSQLRTPMQIENLQYIRPRFELISKQSFRAPIEDIEEIEGAQSAYSYRMNPTTGGYSQDYKQQPSYYVPPSYPMAQQPNPGPQYSLSVPAMSTPYMQQPQATPPHVQAPRTEYGPYDQSGYTRSYEALNNSMPPTSKPISAPPTTMAPITQSQSGMYPPMNMQRPMASMSPVTMDSRNSVPYRPSPYGVSAPTTAMDHNRQSQSTPQLKYEDRRDSNQSQSQHYQSPRTPYYTEAAGSAMPQVQYSQPSPMGHPPMGQWGPGQGHP